MFAASGDPGDSGVSGQECIRDAAGFGQGNICTANDVGIARFNVDNPPASCLEGELVTLQLQAEVESTSNAARFDIGIFIDEGGGNAQDVGNVCYRDFLNPIDPTPTVGELEGGVGPFLDAEGQDADGNADLCGDIAAMDFNRYNLDKSITLVCEDNDDDGKLDVGTCTSWDVTADQNLCQNVFQAVPDQSSKCECGFVQVGDIEVRKFAHIEVIKDLIPSTDSGLFELQIDGASYVNGSADTTGQGDGGTTGSIMVDAGTSLSPGMDHTVGEIASGSTDLNDYSSSVECVDRDLTTFDGGDPLTASGSGPVTVPTDPEDDIVCTITNARAPQVKVVKELVPAGDTGLFDLAIGGTTFVTDGGDGADTGFQPFAVGATPTVSETAGTGTSLADYESSIACDNGQSADPGTELALDALSAGDQVTCTITNTKKAKVELQKTTDGIVDPSFDFDFELYNGPDGFGGAVLASATTFNDADGLLEFGGAILIPGQTYTICERDVPVGWAVEWTFGGNPIVPYNPNSPDDIGNRCYDFEAEAGATYSLEVNNIPPPGGDAHTIGYWRNWNQCTSGNQAETAANNGGAAAGFFLVEDVIPQVLGTLAVNDCGTAVSLLSKQDLSGKNSANDGAYALASQLLAYKFNVAAGAATCQAAVDAAGDGDALLMNIMFDGTGSYLPPKGNKALRNEAIQLASTLDSYNNNTLCGP